MLRRLSLPNKPLAVISDDGTVYIGDAHGYVYRLPSPFIAPRVLFQSPGPVSALAFRMHLYYGNWDGDVGIVGGRTVNLGVHMVKCMLIHRDLVYVSAGLDVHVLDLNLNTVCSHRVEHKVLAMTVFRDAVHCGMGVSFIAKIDGGLSMLGRSIHDTSILCMQGEYTGSADGIVLQQNYSHLQDAQEIYRGSGWIRALHSQDLFSDGRSVVACINGTLSPIYSHEEDVVGVTQVGSTIISIGLDYAYSVFEASPHITPEEERELAELMD